MSNKTIKLRNGGKHNHTDKDNHKKNEENTFLSLFEGLRCKITSISYCIFSTIPYLLDMCAK